MPLKLMPRPDAHDLACNAGHFAATDEGVPQFVRVVVGQQSLHARGNRVEVGVLHFLKVDIREYLSRYRRKRYFPKHDILPQSLFARFALQPLIVNYFNAFQLRFSQTEIEKDKQSVRTFRLLVRLAIIDKSCLFVFGERFALFGLAGGSTTFFMGGYRNPLSPCRRCSSTSSLSRQFRVL